MRLVETDLPGVLVLEPEPVEDERGSFARIWDREPLRTRGLTAEIAQVSAATNRLAGTLRGLHYQAPPAEEAKTIRCTSGAVFDVAVDLRQGSPTHLKWVAVELSATNRRGLYVPEGCAHGYMTLTDGAELEYLISAPYDPSASRGCRWDDPALGIAWPMDVRVISSRDAALPHIDTGP
jgi:dTDP-4-dehydrorhamnose 3,5-epimerase